MDSEPFLAPGIWIEPEQESQVTLHRTWTTADNLPACLEAEAGGASPSLPLMATAHTLPANPLPQCFGIHCTFD